MQVSPWNERLPAVHLSGVAPNAMDDLPTSGVVNIREDHYSQLASAHLRSAKQTKKINAKNEDKNARAYCRCVQNSYNSQRVDELIHHIAL